MIARKAGVAVFALFSLLSLAAPALAQTGSVTGSASGVVINTSVPLPSTCTINGKSVPCDQVAKQVGGFVGTALIIFVVWIAVVLAFSVFWLMMLIHAATHPIQNRALWILVIVLFNVIGAFVYYLAVKRPFDRMAMAALGASPTAMTSGEASPLPAPVSPQLAEYVRTSRAQGVADAATRQSLIAAGWNAADVDRALKS